MTNQFQAVNLDLPKSKESMFEYTKQILTKVSFDKNLFRKELVKAIRILKREERRLLKMWCIASFAAYSDIVIEAFKKFHA